MRQLRSILLTGGAGFVGSSLARHLLETKGLERLVILDKLTYAARRDSLYGIDQDPRLLFVEGDIADRALLTKLIQEHKFTGIFNLAAETNIDRSILEPDPFITTNILGTNILLEACRLSGTPLLQCSTSKVYGHAPPPEKSFEEDPLNPSSPYAATKASADLLCQAAHASFGQDIIITRSSTNYGPRQHPEKLIPNIVFNALRNEPIQIRGDGMQIRDWIHVDDHCDGMIAAFLRGKAGQAFNFGGNCERTTIGIARDVLRILGKPNSLITHVPPRPGQERRLAADTTKSLRYFSWTPQAQFQDKLPAIVRELSASLIPAS